MYRPIGTGDALICTAAARRFVSMPRKEQHQGEPYVEGRKAGEEEVDE